MEHSLLGTFVPRERRFQELSFRGTFAPVELSFLRFQAEYFKNFSLKCPKNTTYKPYNSLRALITSCK